MTKIKLNQLDNFRFEATNSLNKKVILDGPQSIGGGDNGFRPMEMILIGLAGCSSFDVISILKKSRQPIENLKVEVEGKRVDAVPSVYESIHLNFKAPQSVSETHLQKAIKLSVDKYCSVAHMLNKGCKITYSYEVYAV